MRTGLIFTLLAIISFQTLAENNDRGFSVNATRVVFSGNQNAATLSVTNHYDKEEFLVQSWIDDGQKHKKGDVTAKAPFLITPPLFRLAGKTSNEMRIVRTGGNLPEDRESVFWVNVKFIPKSIKPKGNSLSIAVKNRLKLFWRPEGIVTHEGNHGYEKLSFKYKNNSLWVSNPSPFFVTLSTLSVNGRVIKQQGIMFPPKSEIQCPKIPVLTALKAIGQNQIKWRAINDYGARTEELAATF